MIIDKIRERMADYSGEEFGREIHDTYNKDAFAEYVKDEEDCLGLDFGIANAIMNGNNDAAVWGLIRYIEYSRRYLVGPDYLERNELKRFVKRVKWC